jgi:hypothetical protein
MGSRHSLTKGIEEEVYTHSQSLFTGLRRVFVNALVLPAIPEIRLERIKHNQSPLIENTKGLRGATVMLMNLRQPVWKLIKNMKYGMVRWNFSQLSVGKYFCHLPSKRFIKAVVVIRMKESTPK